MKPKICFIVSSPQSIFAFLRGHLMALREFYDIHLVANFESEEDRSALKEYTTHDVKIVRKVNIKYDLGALLTLYTLFRKEKFKVVHSITPKAGLITALAAKLAGVPNRIHIYTGQVWATMQGWRRTFFKNIDKLIYALNSRLLVDGRSQFEFLCVNQIINSQKALVLGSGSISGVDMSRFNYMDEIREKWREELGIGQDKVVFLFLGRLNKDKGITELLAAFDKLLATSYDKAYLLLVGPDEENYDELIDSFGHIKRGVNFTNYGYTKTPELLAQVADVFCLPSYREGFGTSVLEASSLGLPVICSDAYGVMDAMVDEVTGLRCKVADVDSLCEAMKRLYLNPELRRELGHNGRERVKTNFSARYVTDLWVKFYKEMISGNKYKY